MEEESSENKYKFFRIKDCDKREGMRITESYGAIYDTTQPTKKAVLRRLERFEENLVEDGHLINENEFLDNEIGENAKNILKELNHNDTNYDEVLFSLCNMHEAIVNTNDDIVELKGFLKKWQNTFSILNDPTQRRGKAAKLRQSLVAFTESSENKSLNLDDMSFNELRSMAADKGIKFSKNPSRQDIVNQLKQD